MSTPAPPWTGTGSFRSVLHPQHVAAILNLLISGSPFGSTLARFPTNRREVAWPTAKPDAPAWLPEMGDIPVVGLGDDAVVVGVCKLASIVLTSNEAWADTDVNLTTEFGNLLRDSASAELDRGLLYGAGAPEPAGAVPGARPAEGADLGAAITAAIGSIGDYGGVASHLCARPSVLAEARDLRDAAGVQLHPAGIGGSYGLQEVGVPQLDRDDILVIDSARTFLIVRSDFAVDISGDYAFRQDAQAIRIRGRFAIGVPSVDKALRSVSVTGAGPAARPAAPAKAK
jgi:HK97 family phage major capsid protein